MEILKYGGYANFKSDHHIQSILKDFREMVIDVTDSFQLFRDLSAQNFIHGINALDAFIPKSSNIPQFYITIFLLGETQVSQKYQQRIFSMSAIFEIWTYSTNAFYESSALRNELKIFELQILNP